MRPSDSRKVRLDLLQVAHQVARRRPPGHAGVTEAYLVGKHDISEQDSNLLTVFLYYVGTIEQVRLHDIPGPVSQSHSERSRKHSLARHHPIESGAVHNVYYLLPHCLLRWPQPARRHSKVQLIGVHRQAQLSFDILRAGEPLSRQIQLGTGDPRKVSVVKQWHDRMVKRRGRNLNLAGLLHLPIERHYFSDDLSMLRHH